VDPIEKSLELIREDLKAQLLQRGPLNRAAEVLGVNPRYLYDVLNGDNAFAFEFYLQLVQTFDLHTPAPMQTFERLLVGEPEELLLAQRGSEKPETCHFLSRLVPRVQRLKEAPLGADTPGTSFGTYLSAIEEQRFGDRWAALEAAEDLAVRIARYLESVEGPKPATAMGELAATIALWATIQRMRGFRGQAFTAFKAAFPLARHAGNAWAEGSCYQRAAYLLRDVDRADFGHGFINQAGGLFMGAESPIDSWRCLSDKACMLSDCGLHEQSSATYQLALVRLPGSEWRFRVSSLQGLSVNARLTGRPEQARDFLVKAAAECRKQDLVLSHVKWSRALTDFELGDEVGALTGLRQSVELLARFGSAADIALVCMDHAKILLRLNRQRELAPLIKETLGWLPKLRANPILLRTFEQFLDLARVARIGLTDLEKTRERVIKASRLGEQG
jgi:hypothetical protein